MSAADDQPGKADQAERLSRTSDGLAQGPVGVAFHVESELCGHSVLVLRAVGEIDMTTAPLLGERVNAHLEPDAVTLTQLVFDLTQVTFFASAGLAILAATHRECAERGIKMCVVANSHAVLRPLRITELDSVLTVVDDLTSALGDQ